MNVRNAGVFALMFAASLLLLLPGCRSPMGPDAPGIGTVSLSVERLDMSRAIMPDIGLGDFGSFRVVFSHATLAAPVVPDGTLTEVSANIELPAGTGWTVDVDALIGSDIVARGRTTFEVVADDSRQIAVTLYPLGDEGNGTFAWTLTFPGNVTTGSIAVIGETSVPLPAGAASTWAGYITLPADNYVVHINLENPDGMVIIEMELLIFGNLESSFTFDFVPGDFAPMPEAALASAITIAEGIRYGVYTSADGTDILVGSFWATAEAITAFENAIAAARAVLLDTGATPATLNAARLALLAAQATFEGAIGPGTQDPIAGPALVGTPGTVDRTSVDIVLGADGMAALITGGHFAAVGAADMGTGAGYVFVHNMGDNGSGIQILPASAITMTPGYRYLLRATGRTTGAVTNSRLELANLTAGGGAGLGNEAVTPGSAFSIPESFTFTRELTAENVAAGLRIAPNGWNWGAAGSGDASFAERFEGFAFSIDDLIIFREEIIIGNQAIRFNLADPAGVFQTTGAIAGTGLTTNGTASAAVRTATYGTFTDRNFLYISGRTQNYHGLNVTGVNAGDIVRVTGRRGAYWQSDFEGVIEIQEGGDGETAIGIEAGTIFTIVGTASASTIRIAVNAWGGAGDAAARSANASFYIYSIIVGTDLDQPAAIPANTVNVTATENFWPPAGAGGNGGNGGGEDDGPEVNLSAHIADLAVGDILTTATLPSVLSLSGSPTITVARRGGLNYLTVTGRGANHYGVDIVTPPAGYYITVRGRAPTGTTMVIGGVADPWGWWRNTTASVFLLQSQVPPHAELESYGANEGLRVQSNCTTSFQIYDIIVSPTRPNLSPIPPLTAFTAADWQRVIDSYLVRPRSSTLAATAAGLLISGRGTGEHDNNNGLLVDVARLRTLYGGTPAIVINGTIAGATSGQMQMQGMGVNVPIGAGGAFTVTIPGTAPIDPPDWANTNYPFLGTGTGIHGNITVNSITIGSVHIQDLTHLAGPPGTVRYRFDGGDRTRFANDNWPAGRVNGFDYEAWTDHRGAEGFVMYIYTDGSFRGTWNQTYNTLFRVGRRWPGNVNNPASFPTINEVGNISLRHNTTAFTSTHGATYLTVYGWAFDGNNQIEFYIIDSWRNWAPVDNNGNARPGYTHHGSFQSGGYTWDVVTGWRLGQPALTGQSVNFLQIFSVRRGSQLTGGTGARTSTINVSDHFNRWITNVPAQTGGGTTINFTSSSRLYEVMWCVEGFGGDNPSSGTGIVTELCIIYGSNRVCTNPTTCTHCP